MANNYDKLIRQFSKFRAEITATRNLVPVDTISKCSAIKASLKTIILDHATDIQSAADEVERRSKDLRHFKILNDLSYEPNYNDSLVNLAATAILVVALESAANAYFFGQASEAGLAGGFFTAGMISFLNVLVGFIAGAFLLRQFNHVQKWRLVVAAVPLALLVPTAIIFNLIVGHYREALLQNPDSVIIDIVPTALRNLGELKSLESLILVAVGIIIFFFAMYEGYTVWDKYPGYMSKHKARRDAEYRLKEACDLANDDANERLATEIQDFESIGALLRSNKSKLEAVGRSLDGKLSELESEIDQIEQAGNAAMKIYRAANFQVRSPRVPVPRYFSADFKLDRPSNTLELKAVREELSAAFDAVRSAEVVFENSQSELASARAAIMTNVLEMIEGAECDARTRARAEHEDEIAHREALRSATK